LEVKILFVGGLFWNVHIDARGPDACSVLIFFDVCEGRIDGRLARRFVRFDAYGTVDYDFVLGTLIGKNAADDDGKQNDGESYGAETAHFHCEASFDITAERINSVRGALFPR